MAQVLKDKKRWYTGSEETPPLILYRRGEYYGIYTPWYEC